jgi:hypothetical protein
MLALRLLFLGTTLAAASVPGRAQLPFFATCQEDSGIQPEKRKILESVAMDFVHKVLGANPEIAFDMMSDAGKGSSTREQLKAMAIAMFQKMQLRNISPLHTYIIELKGQSPGRVLCGTDYSRPEGWELLEAADVSEQAHVLISANTVNNLMVVSLWLVREQGEWKVQSFWMNAANLADLDSMKLRQLGHVQQAKGHNLNALVLYTTAAQLANRGPSIRLGIAQSIADDLTKVSVPSEIQGPAPFSWNIGPIAVGGKIYLMLVHETAPWQSNAQVEGWNKELLRYFKIRFPEYSDSFAGLVARAHERGGRRGFGTVEDTPASK